MRNHQGGKAASAPAAVPDFGLVRRALLRWYERNRRDLPWRRDRDPYRIWISEIMLQQTRVAAVIPYYERFLARFPTVQALADAREQDLLAAWAGLGYYSRARNLGHAAKKIVETGGFPRDHAVLRSLKGIGDYTAAAIASIAFGGPHLAMDGNAIRVLSRLTNERGNVLIRPVRDRLSEAGGRWLDRKRPGDFNQALMDLGATVCLPKEPRCVGCPVGRFCAARAAGVEKELPLKIPHAKPIEVEKALLVVERGGRILAWQRDQESRRLAGFWELPEYGEIPGARLGRKLGTFRHTIVNTSYRYEVYRAALPSAPRGFRWLTVDKLHEIALSTAAKKALRCLGRQGDADAT